MELTTFQIPASLKKFVIAPLGDIQWSGPAGPTAQDHLKRHIDYCLSLDAFFLGTGDYIDFLSPSNRRRLESADLYDTAKDVIWKKATELTDQVFDKFLAPTVGRWIGLVEGHHFSQFEGQHTDEILADKLKCKFLGTSAFVKLRPSDIVLYVHHGMGGGVLPASGLNKMYHLAAGLQGADVYCMGHNTKLVSGRLSRPYPVWGKKDDEHDMEDKDVMLLNCGGFSKSNILKHSVGGRPRGDYAEQGMMTPSPLNAPIIQIDLTQDHPNYRIRVSI